LDVGRLAGMLQGVRVLDLSRVLAGPYCTQLLADLGADVVKVESPKGDDTRTWGPPWLGDVSGYYLSVNRGKRSLAVDLKDPRGAELVRRLAAGADLVVENFKVGDLTRFGLDYEAVATANPRAVYVSITGFGQTGPRANEPGYDAALQALTGVMAMTGEEGRPPVKLPVAYIDVLTGLHAAVGALAALRRAAATGQGARLDVSLFDVALASAVNQAQGVLLTGEAPRRLGSGHPSIVPYQSFEAADGALVLAVGNDGQFSRLCGVLGVPAMAADERYATNAARVAHRDEVVGTVARLVAGWKRDDLVAACTAAGVPATPVLTLPEAFADPQAAARGSVVRGTQADGSPVPMVASPLWFAHGLGGADLGLRPQEGEAPVPPAVGEHSFEVLTRDLGLTAEEARRLVDEGVVVDGRRDGAG
jgi:crotonobetainyl-CoA:carnitine CoA-transferase CaiB-like acyl-CoA transferase